MKSNLSDNLHGLNARILIIDDDPDGAILWQCCCEFMATTLRQSLIAANACPI
jgi:hypothetical protein